MGSVHDPIEDLAESLSSEVYVLAPDDSKYFFGEVALAGVATVLVGAFVKGLIAGVGGQIESWGKSCGAWLATKVGAIARSGKGDTADEVQLKADLKALPGDASDYRAAVLAVLGHVLHQKGMTQQEATNTADRVASAADAMVSAKW